MNDEKNYQHADLNQLPKNYTGSLKNQTEAVPPEKDGPKNTTIQITDITSKLKEE